MKDFSLIIEKLLWFKESIHNSFKRLYFRKMLSIGIVRSFKRKKENRKHKSRSTRRKVATWCWICSGFRDFYTNITTGMSKMLKQVEYQKKKNIIGSNCLQICSRTIRPSEVSHNGPLNNNTVRAGKLLPGPTFERQSWRGSCLQALASERCGRVAGSGRAGQRPMKL